MEIEGTTVMVTGGAVRLGRALVAALAAAGSRVVIHYGGSKEAAFGLREELRAQGSAAWAVQGDLRSPEVCAQVVDQAVALAGPLTMLVNSAAIFPAGSFAATTVESWEEVFALDLRAPFLLTQRFAGQLPANTPGRVVNIVDGRVFRPGTDHFAYRIAKAALAEMTRILALELAPDATVNAVAPGAMLEASGDQPGLLAQRVEEMIPLRRAGGVEPVVAAVLYLLRSDFVTGEILRVDGGEYL